MRINFTKSLGNLMLLMLLPALPIFAQNAQVTLGKHVGRIPHDCEGVVPASIEGAVDIPGLVRNLVQPGVRPSILRFSRRNRRCSCILA